MTGEEYMEFSNRDDFNPSGPENIQEIRRQGVLMAKLGLVSLGMEAVAADAHHEWLADSAAFAGTGFLTGALLTVGALAWVKGHPKS